MPLLIAKTTAPTPAEPTPSPPGGTQLIGAVWTGPTGAEWNLLDSTAPTGSVILNEGVDGLGAAPREVVRSGLAGGGSLARWSRASERLITLPVLLFGATPQEFTQVRRTFTKAFTSTTPAAGIPRPGTLTITRGDGTKRQAECIYLEGLGWTDQGIYGITSEVVVLQLLAPDPWWYGESVAALSFEVVGSERSYLNPYESVSPDTQLGEQTITVIGDAAASPVWTVTGPAAEVEARIVGGPRWIMRDIQAGEVITIDTTNSTVTDQTGANRIGELVWPHSSLFTLPPGEVDISVTLTGGEAGASSVRLEYRPRLETA